MDDLQASGNAHVAKGFGLVVGGTGAKHAEENTCLGRPDGLFCLNPDPGSEACHKRLASHATLVLFNPFKEEDLSRSPFNWP